MYISEGDLKMTLLSDRVFSYSKDIFRTYQVNMKIARLPSYAKVARLLYEI